MDKEVGSFAVKKGLAQMLKGGVIMDVVTPEHAIIAEEAGAVAVMALERVPADIRAAHERPGFDHGDHGIGLHSGNGEDTNRALC
jgi:pyridoxal biosynthesis lyase PdxS